MPERITFTTDDGVTIVGDWSPAPTILGAVLLLHMMPETRSSWAPFQRALAKRGLGSLAIDMRGHGESTATEDGDVVDYREFEDSDHQSSSLDAAAAIDWIRKRGVDLDRIAVGGASFGANLAIQVLTDYPRLPGALLLSPGENYHGLSAFEDMENLHPEQALFIAAAEDDQKSFADSKKLYADAPTERKQFVPYKNAGHGTNMFKIDPQLMEKAADWFAEIIKG